MKPNYLEEICSSIEGNFEYDYDILNYPINIDQISRLDPINYPSKLQIDYPHAYVALKAVNPDDNWNFTKSSIESLFSSPELMELESLKGLIEEKEILDCELGKQFLSKLKEKILTKSSSSLASQVFRYLEYASNEDIQETVIIGDRYLVKRNLDKELEIYDVNTDLVKLMLCPAKKNGRTLRRTLGNNEKRDLLNRPDHYYYARIGTNFSHDNDDQAEIYMDDDEYSGVMIEIKETDFIGFSGRMHPTASIPHLVKVDRVYWKEYDKWYDSVDDFTEEYQSHCSI